MPLQQCKKDGKSGWQWGSSGVCYVGKDAKKRAVKQGLAIEGPEKFKKIMQKAKSSEDWHDMMAALQEDGEAKPTYQDDLLGGLDEALKGGAGGRPR